MDSPIKIIFKYKNNNRRVQYHQYIFLGNLNTEALKSLKKIQDLSFYDSIMTLDDEDLKILEKTYSENWYKFFFNNYHLNFSFENIIKNKKSQNEIIKKMGEVWYNNHIKNQEIIEQKIVYTYGTLIRNDILRKEYKKRRNYNVEEELELDYTTVKKKNVSDVIYDQKRTKSNINSDQDDISTSPSFIVSDSQSNDLEADSLKKMAHRSEKDLMENNNIQEGGVRKKLFDSEEDLLNDNDDISEDKFDNASRPGRAIFFEENIEKDQDDYNVSLLNKMANIEFKKQKGGLLDDDDEGEYDLDIGELEKEYNEDEYDELKTEKDTIKKEIDTNGDGEIEFEEGMDNDMVLEDEELELEDIEKIYQDTDIEPDKNIIKTSNLIQQALKDDKIFKKMENAQIDFDTTNNDVIYDESLRNVFIKNYVTNQYIYKDDTIITIKKKICSAIRNNPIFEKEALIIPSRQYLWSEYIYENKVEKVMIGQKWIKRSDLLNIDVEPNNNLRIYEELRGNLKFLRDNIRRYGSKIKREDDDYNILYDYENYYTNNEIFLIDIYNELGKNYSPDSESLKNLTDVYIRIYFPRIKTDDIKYILDYLNGDTKVESNKTRNMYETINNELVLDNEIMREVEKVKKKTVYKTLFKENYITQSVIHVNLRSKIDIGKKSITMENVKIDLFRIFNEFEVNNKYPFIQYQTLDGQIIFKYSEEDIEKFSSNKENIDVLSKWFENAPYGISFKVKITENENEKFMAINLTENGRMEYKTQWKEEDMATIEDVKKTYEYVKDLLKKINEEKNKVFFEIPENYEFKYAFINTIQKFELPEKFHINHNDLSEFARYFYPYIALVIEPRKRQSKIKKFIEKSKYGTYLRYKRVSKYENQARIEQRVLYFMRNYDYNENTLSNEISKQFNITLERATLEIERVKNKYPNIKKSRKILKKLENIPKYKPPGIGIDIQGKQRDKYKIRISGARNKDQLDRIINFMNILIYLYSETYLFKKPERQAFKEKLKMLTNIAKRRNKVEDFVDYEKEVKSVKQMTQLDKKRIGFKPEKGQNQWTRSCQNSGNDKKRRPQQYVNVEDLAKQGFKLNNNYGVYEKKLIIKNKNGKKKEVLIRAAGLDTLDDEGNPTGTIYYSCNPNENGDHMYVGFLSRSNNPYGQCMPCCFKKDPLESKNKEKKDYYLKCIGKINQVEKQIQKPTGDKLYILQDTNKIQEGRFGFLPKYLDYFLNKLLNKTKKIKHHYLLSSSTGYYFKYGSKQSEQSFLNAIASTLDLNLNEIKKKIIEKLQEDKNDQIFTALNNGDIKTSFILREKYIDFLEKSTNINYELVNHILSMPGIIKPNGLNFILFRKESLIITKTLEKEKIIDDFTIVCQNPEETENLLNPKRETILILRENKNYYPIALLSKKNEQTKNFDIKRTFVYEERPDNIIKHLYDFYERNCNIEMGLGIKSTMIAKKLYNMLINLNVKEYNPQYQIIDARNKCKYIVTINSTIIPVTPSGSIYNLKIIKSVETKLYSYREILNKLKELSKISKKEIKVNPIGVYYDSRGKTENEINIIGIMTEVYELVPIVPQIINVDVINKDGLIMEYRQLYDKIDLEIYKGTVQIDSRIKEVTYDNYYNESYELFRLHLSEYINQEENEDLKKKIKEIINDINYNQRTKKNIIRSLIFKRIDNNLFLLAENANKQEGGKKSKKIVNIINKIPDLSSYQINNNREICNNNETKETCQNNIHCSWSQDGCNLGLVKEMVITFVNKVSEELASGDHKAFELLRENNYFVSDIVNYNKYKERPGQKIIKSTNNSINKILSEIFGKENIPKIGKRRIFKTNNADQQEINIENPLNNMGDYYLQKIITNNMSILRAFTNGYNWIKQSFYDLETRNLGYYSNLQTDMTNYFRSNIIDWLMDANNLLLVKQDLSKYIDINKKNFITDYINKISRDVMNNTNGIVELYILNQIYKIPIIVYDRYNTILYIIDQGVKYDYKENNLENKIYSNYKNINNLKNIINIRYVTQSMSGIPLTIEVAYYK